MAGAKRSEVFPVSTAIFWDIVVDYENYPKFLKDVEKIEVIDRTKNKATVRYTVNKLKRITYILEHTETPKKKMTWKMLEGEFFKSNDGSWTLKELKDGKTEVTYELEIGMPALVPKSIVRGMVEQSLPEMISIFGERAKKAAKKAGKKK